MNKLLLGLITGIAAGIIDVIPMFAQKLSWDANLSAFSMWVVIGIFISMSDFNMNGILKGIIISFLTLLPTAIIIGRKEPFTLVPITIMTLILGGVAGFVITKFGK
jgi:hypothetical protein